MTKTSLLVKYGEISLRKANRTFFEDMLLNRIRQSLSDKTLRVAKEQGRFIIEDLKGDLDINKTVNEIKYIFGLIGFSPCITTNDQDIKNLCNIAIKYFLKDIKQSFKVSTKRSNKNYPLTSNEVSAIVGEEIVKNLPDIIVKMKNPDTTLYIELRNNAYIYVNTIKGEGGLPYASQGKGVLLLSGGFDSPVAGYLAARRGVGIFPMYFHSPPFVSERAADKAHDLVKVLSKYTGETRLMIIPFTDIQLFLKEHVSPEKLTIYLKRAMLRIADIVAVKEKMQCIITGDSIGQVASQTMHSLTAVNSAATLPIIRPLCTMDKQEILNIAERIGTYDISVRPFDDCCTLFVAKHPENKPNTNVIEKLEKKLMDRLMPLLEDAIDKVLCF